MTASDGGNTRAGLNSGRANVARMWDYYLGGTDNSDADRDAARIVLGAAPDVPLAALENREFLRHAIRFLVEEAGIRQFVDIGPGLPTQGNVHQLVRKHAPDARVVYVDNDPLVVEHGRAKTRHVPGVGFLAGDLRNPVAILADPNFRELISFAEPVALCMTLVLHFIAEREDPYRIVEQLSGALCSGSYLVISHVTGDGRDDATLDKITGIYNHASAALVMRDRGQITRFFDGVDLVPPGLVFLSQWQPTTEHYAGGGTRWAYAGVGRKTSPADSSKVIT